MSAWTLKSSHGWQVNEGKAFATGLRATRSDAKKNNGAAVKAAQHPLRPGDGCLLWEQFDEISNVLDIFWIIWDCRNASCIPESLRHGLKSATGLDLETCVFVGGCQQSNLGEWAPMVQIALGFACNHMHFICNSCLFQCIFPWEGNL